MSDEKYLFKRKGSQNWYVRLQNVEKNGRIYKSFEKSLGTPDIDLARIRADAIIHEHRLILFTKKQSRLGRYEMRRMYDVDELIRLSDGTTIIADDQIATFFDATGKMISRTPNEKVVVYKPMPENDNERKLMERTLSGSSSTVKPSHDIITNWVKENDVSPRHARDATRTLEQFMFFVNGKNISDCTRTEVKQFANHLLKGGIRSATVAKKLSFLRAACNIALDDGKIRGNPFVRIPLKNNDSLRRVPLSAADMQKVRENLRILTDHDQLLWVWLASTGMRLGEAFQIREEFEEEGSRYVMIGTKTRSSQRRVPIPQAVIEYGQGPIKSNIFDGRPAAASNRLLTFLRRLEISYDNEKDTGRRDKVIHSLRHRAKDRLRASRCPLELQYELLGHEIVTVAGNYGVGSPVPILREWIDKIGY